MLSALFDPATTPITPYFTATLQLLHQHPCSHFAKCEPVRIEFEAASEETLETLRRFAIDLTPFLAPSDARACKQSLMTFRFANSRFFRALRSGTAVIPEPFASVVDEGLALFAANQLLTVLAGAFTSRELMLEDGKVLPKPPCYEVSIADAAEALNMSTSQVKQWDRGHMPEDLQASYPGRFFSIPFYQWANANLSRLKFTQALHNRTVLMTHPDLATTTVRD